MKIEVKNIFYKYNKFDKDSDYDIKGISIDILNNDYLAIVGETGSGKSTFVQHLNGLIKADLGDILIDGVSIYSKNYDMQKLKFKVGLVFQYPEYQFFSETVLEDVSFGAINMGFSKEEANKKAEYALKMMGIEKEYFDKFPFILSGGEKRKVAIAGILVMEPDVLILDEPQAGLDPMSKKELFNILNKLHKMGKTIIIITHNMEDVIENAKRVAALKNGKIIAVDYVENFFMNNEIINNINLMKPEQILLIEKLKKKYNDIDLSKIREKEIIDEIKQTIHL